MIILKISYMHDRKHLIPNTSTKQVNFRFIKICDESMILLSIKQQVI